MSKSRSVFERQITVDKEIVSLLSKSTYQRNFPYAIRELVSNAYDADSTLVQIDVNIDKEEIQILDNGNGMSLAQFDFYLRIAGTHKHRSEFTPKFNRLRIGHFGIGFLSIFPFCKELEIVSTSESSDEIFIAKIPVSKFFRPTTIDQDVGEISIHGVSYKDETQRDEHYTKIRLIGLTDRAHMYLKTKEGAEGKRKRDPASPLERLKWELQEDLPLQHSEDSPLFRALRYDEPIGMTVKLNGDSLVRNSISGEVIDQGVIQAGGIRAAYAFITPWKAITPLAARHVKLRVRNVGVGKRDNFGLGRRLYSRLAWLSGEVQILEGAELTMNRDDFIMTPEYDAFIEQIGAKLRKLYDYIEDVDTSRRSMSSKVRGGKQQPVASKKDILESNIRRLTDRGFNIERSAGGPAFSVSTADRKIVVDENHPDLRDELTLQGKAYTLIYSAASEQDPRPCWFSSPSEITVNSKYPLFRSRRYGEVFKRVQIAILIAEKRARSVEKMHEFLLRCLAEDFIDFS